MRSGVKLSLDLIGDRATQAKLKRLGFKTARKANRQGVRVGITPIAKAVRRNVPVDEADLKKATASKVVGKSLNVIGIVGADANYRAAVEGGRLADEKIPANYDHNVNDGHVNPDGTFTPGVGYIQKSEREAAPQAQARYIEKAVQIIEKDATK